MCVAIAEKAKMQGSGNVCLACPGPRVPLPALLKSGQSGLGETLPKKEGIKREGETRAGCLHISSALSQR